MGLSCKPVGKLGGTFKKLDNALEKERLAQKNNKDKDKNNVEDVDH